MNKLGAIYVLWLGLLVLPRTVLSENAIPAFVVARDVPQHSAFRQGDKGEATKIATARPDVVLSATSETQGVPQMMSDAMLGSVGNAISKQSSEHAASAQGMTGSSLNQPILSSSSAGAGVAVLIGSAMQPAAAVGSVVSHSMAPLSGLLQAMPGIR